MNYWTEQSAEFAQQRNYKDNIMSALVLREFLYSL